MKISDGMINHYLEDVTAGWFLEHELPPDNINEYYDRVMVIKADALHHSDLEPLRLGLDYLICHPEIDLHGHGDVFSWSDEAVREIIHYIRSVVYPDSPAVNCAEVKDVELVHTSRFEWWDSREGREHHRYYNANGEPISEEEWLASKQP